MGSISRPAGEYLKPSVKETGESAGAPGAVDGEPRDAALRAEQPLARPATDIAAASAATTADVSVPDGGDAPIPGSVDEARRLAVECRTNNGDVGPDGYRRFMEAARKVDLEKLKAIEDYAAEVLEQPVTMEALGSGAGLGISGAAIHIVRDSAGNAVAVAKRFPDAEELVRQLSANEDLDECRKFSAPPVLGVAVAEAEHDGVDTGLMLMSIAPGQSMHRLLADVGAAGEQRDAALARADAAFAAVGAALGELHSRPAGSGGTLRFPDGEIRSAEMDSQEVNAREYVDNLLEYGDEFASIGVDVTELHEAMMDAVNEGWKDMGPAARIHGDAHPPNIFWDEEAGVTFLDSALGHHSVNATGEAIGGAVRDVANMMYFSWRDGKAASMPDSEIEREQGQFRAGYRDAGGPEIEPVALRGFGVGIIAWHMWQAAKLIREPGGANTEELGADLAAKTGYLREGVLKWEL